MNSSPQVVDGVKRKGSRKKRRGSQIIIISHRGHGARGKIERRMMPQNNDHRSAKIFFLIFARHGFEVMMLMSGKTHVLRIVKFIFRKRDIVEIAFNPFIAQVIVWYGPASPF